jgi:hypothetical protein
VKRISTLAQRVPGKRLTFDEMLLLRTYVENEDVDILGEYCIQPQDIDVLDHLSPYSKIKSKTLSSVKKWLK